MRACLYLRVERPLGGATLEERLVGLQEGVLDHHHRNFRSRRRVHDPQNIGEVSLGVGDGQRTRKIFILHIDDYERSFHMSLPLVPLIFSRAARPSALSSARLRMACTIPGRYSTHTQTVHSRHPMMLADT